MSMVLVLQFVKLKHLYSLLPLVRTSVLVEVMEEEEEESQEEWVITCQRKLFNVSISNNFVKVEQQD